MSKTTLLKKAENYCQEHGFRFTDPRRLVLKIIAASKKPVVAYDILKHMGKITKEPKPTTIYRAIDFWQEQGFVHKIESINAFVTCDVDHAHAGSQFMLCNDCGHVEEVHLCQLPKDLNDKLNHNGFKMNSWNTEIHGQCHRCQ